VSRLRKVPPKSDIETEPESEVEDAEASMPPLSSDADDMDVDDEPIVKPKKRKPRKVVPVGRNGLKKKRVVKTRTTTDPKGYIRMFCPLDGNVDLFNPIRQKRKTTPHTSL